MTQDTPRAGAGADGASDTASTTASTSVSASTSASTSVSTSMDGGALRGLRTRLLAWGVLALLCAQLFYGVLVGSSLHRQYRGPMLAVQALTCDDLALRLGRMDRLGKPLDRIRNLSGMLTPFRTASTAAELLVTDAAGAVLGAWDAARLGTALPVPRDAASVPGSNAFEFAAGGDTWLTRPIPGRGGATVGHVLLRLDAARLDADLAGAAAHLPLFGGIAAGSCLLLAVLCFVLLPGNGGTLPHAAWRRRARMVLLLPLLAGQICLMAVMGGPLKDIHVRQSGDIATQLAGQLGRDLSSIVAKGVPLERLPGIETHLQSLQRGLPQVVGIGMLGADGTLLSAANAAGPLDAAAWSGLGADAPQGASVVPGVALSGGQGDAPAAGAVRVLMSSQAIAGGLREALLDTATVSVVAMLLLVELASLLLVQAERGVMSPRPALADMPGFMRAVIFFCMCAIDLSVSFIPLRLAELDAGLFGLPRDVVMGLPVSFEMLMVGIAIVAGGTLAERYGWRPLLLAGVALAAAGAAASGVAVTPLGYILARGVAGAGYGCINLAAQVHVVGHSTPHNRAANLGSMFAGLFAGVMCASATGGLVADRVGYGPVFLVSAVLLCAVLAWLLLCPSRDLPGTRVTADEPQAPAEHRGGVAAFLRDRRMAALLLCNIMPLAFVTVCLFQFFVPVYLNADGASPADIGRVSMLFCLVVVYLGPLCGRLVDASPRKHRALTVAGLLGAASVAALLAGSGIGVAVAAVCLLGMSNAVASSGQGTYALQLPAAAIMGRSRTMSLYNVMERVGQVLGPVSFGVVLAMWGRDAGLVVMAAGMGAASLLFFACTTGRPDAVPGAVPVAGMPGDAGPDRAERP